MPTSLMINFLSHAREWIMVAAITRPILSAASLLAIGLLIGIGVSHL